jgi:hypothetical protein
MTAISTFPTIKNVMKMGEDTMRNFVAGGTILAGQVVAIVGATTVNDFTVTAAIDGVSDIIIGVAVTGATTGQAVSVAGIGAIVQVANYDSAAAIPAGAWVKANSNAVGGTVMAVATGAGVQVRNVVGQCVGGIAANGTGYVIVNPIVLYNYTSNS